MLKRLATRFYRWLLTPFFDEFTQLRQDIADFRTELGLGPAFIAPHVEADYHNAKVTSRCYKCGQEVATYRKFHSGLILCMPCAKR